MYAVSALSNRWISPDDLAGLIKPFGAQWESDLEQWRLQRQDIRIIIKSVNDELEDFPEDALQRASIELGGMPQSRVVFLYNETDPGNTGWRMVLAVCVAMAERWPIVLDDHADRSQRIYPPGVARREPKN